ncbi:hypothetical protein CFAM422_008885 [Trichoderma lentiforme]|uniref:IBR domain-containing protein n=1 Tax=Trichoderma lentiforme TaxID=1567552 RepID=A0A9P5CC89_9HYPO|nr:hypothetical protein CFAM422_008885 [Trichoderma lentiforme]
MQSYEACPCGAQFCYVCGIQWKKCSCDQWNEDRLLDRANPAEGRVIRLEGLLRGVVLDRQGCTHRRLWESIDGRFECGSCGEELRRFILRCRDCQILRCVRCRIALRDTNR